MQVEVADLGGLHTFPKCESAADLPHYLGEWISLTQEQGGILPDRHLTTLLVKLLPVEVEDDLKKVNLLYAPHKRITDDLQAEQHRWTDTRAAQAHTQRRFASRPGT